MRAGTPEAPDSVLAARLRAPGRVRISRRRAWAPRRSLRIAWAALVAFVVCAPLASSGRSAILDDLPARAGEAFPGDGARWERVHGELDGPSSDDRPGDDDARSHVARLARHGDDLAWSDARGVVRVVAGRQERVALAEVLALGFDDAGTLWIGTARGLFRWGADGRPERRRLFGGEAANRIRDLVGQGPWLALATEGGLFWSPGSPAGPRRFQPLDAAAIGTPVDRVAIRGAPRDSGARLVELWSARPGTVERVVGLPTEAGLRVVARDRVVLPRHGNRASPVDLRIEATPDGARLVLAQPDALLHRRLGPPGARLDPKRVWTVERPVLTPGARLRRVLLLAAGGVVAATDRGVFEAATLGGPFRRAVGDAGFDSCSDLVVGATGGPWARCRSGLVRRVHGTRAEAGPRSPSPPIVAPDPSARSGAPRASIAPDPPLAEIRTRALSHARLDRARGDRLFRGLARRGLWPEVSLRFGADVDRDDRRDADQAFVSGDTRHLFDRTRDRGTRFDVAIELDWALGEIAYPDDAVDLSREHRQVVSLRDDVADELHQLYFERARLRARLAEGAPLAPEEERALRLRAAELLAGLDAWTGGWLSVWHADRRASDRLHSRSPGPEPTNGRHHP